MQRCLTQLLSPLWPFFSPGGARVRLGATAAGFSSTAAELEGFARPLWGLAPLHVGGGDDVDWSRYQMGLANGTDPEHPEYWGTPFDNSPKGKDQRFVELAALAFGLLLAPDTLWNPLPERARQHVAAYLASINGATLPRTNWLFFRVLTNLALAHVGASHDGRAMAADLDQLEQYHLGAGWYTDGPNRHCDYYNPFAFHFYSLIYARHAPSDDHRRAERFRSRAAEFADEFMYFFAKTGEAVPYGRSLIYRFAQGAFWGALGTERSTLPTGGLSRGSIFATCDGGCVSRCSTTRACSRSATAIRISL